jgi:quercetin dioxygenase-like cupin family protein
MLLRFAILLAMSTFAQAFSQPVRVIRFADSTPFQMGTVTARRIVHPGLGAKKTTLNYSLSAPGAEFAQHVHDNSDDTILVLEGEVNLRQGDSLRLFKAGECAFVPTGQIHGTVTAGKSEATMISFQNPPDFILYTGARDSSRPGAAAPKGVITPGAVRYVDFRAKNGAFTSPAIGAHKSTGSFFKLNPGQTINTKVAPEGELVLFVWRGSLEVTDMQGNKHTAGERDAIFVQGANTLQISPSSPQTEFVQIEAP